MGVEKVPDGPDGSEPGDWASGPEGFERLFRHRYAEMCSYANGFLGDRSEAEDTVQDMFLKLWELRDTLKVQSTLRAYMYKAVRNRCLNKLKQSKTRERLVTRSLATDPPRQSVQPDYEASREQARRIRALKEAIVDLPPRRRAVVELRWLQGMSHREIAEVQGISVKGVEITLTRALRSLRATLGGGRSGVGDRSLVSIADATDTSVDQVSPGHGEDAERVRHDG